MNVALYARVSTDNRGQDVETQFYLLREEANRRGWSVTGEYSDQASAGDTPGRTAWRHVMEMVRERRIDGVAVLRLDRAFRSSRDTYNALEFFQRHGVEFICITQPIDTTRPEGKFLLGVLAAAAEFERDLASERVHDGLARARSQGKRLGRPTGAKDRQKRRRQGYLLRWANKRMREKYGMDGKPLYH